MNVDLREYLTTAVRAWTRPIAEKKARSRRPTSRPDIRHALIVDTETTVDPAQSLLYGAFRYVRLDDQRVATVAEGLIYADDLPESDPTGYAALQTYARAHKADVDMTYLGVEPEWELHLLSRSEFVSQWIYRAGYRKRNAREPALLVMFNAPFDLSRLAVGAAEARGDMYGGFSLIMWTDADGNPAAWRPRLVVKSIDSKRSLKLFRRIERHAQDFAGHILDLRTLVFAITGQSHSLDSACHAFGVDGKVTPPEFGTISSESVDYCRQDVRATTDLLEAALREYDQHPIDLQPTKAYSPASIAKSYIRGMGITPRLTLQPDFPADVLGWSMSAFYGGRAEVHIRNTELPIALVDVTSMYPTVDVLMSLWPLVTAERVETLDATDEVRALLDDITADDCYDRTRWPSFVGLAQVIPDGDILPVRANYGPDPDTPTWSIGLNHLHDDRPHWYAIPDLVASTILTGHPPQIVRAVRFTAHGQQAGLAPIALRGRDTVDPASSDFFRHVVEARQRLKTETVSHASSCDCEDCRTHRFLKVLANSGSYGIYAEMIRKELPAGTRAAVTVHGPDDDPFNTRISAPEDPGEYCFPPIAAVITASARLILALIERAVTDAGGTWMFCDTDSFAIVATDTGGLLACAGGASFLPDGTPAVRALSLDQVAAIRKRINSLNPYRTDLVRDVLKLEMVGRCFAISAKRYVITNTAGAIVKRSLHGLGRLLDPASPDKDRRDDDGNSVWIDDTWQWIRAAHINPDAAMPDWVNLPAMSRVTVSSTWIRRPFGEWNRSRTWAEQIKPFSFIMVATLDPFGYPPGTDPSRFRLIAPYDPNPANWDGLVWRNLYDPDGPTYGITTDRTAPPRADRALAKSYRDLIVEYRVHPEQKFDSPDGGPCRRATAGQLRRRVVRPAGSPQLIGKETNKLDDVQAGIVANVADVVMTYGRANWDPDLVLPVLARYTGRQLADHLNIDRRTIDRIRAGSAPRRSLAAQLTAHAIAVAATDVTSASRPTADALTVLAAWRATHRPVAEQ